MVINFISKLVGEHTKMCFVLLSASYSSWALISEQDRSVLVFTIIWTNDKNGKDKVVIL